MSTESENKTIVLAGSKFEILDILYNVTIPDCIVFNKIGTGHEIGRAHV